MKKDLMPLWGPYSKKYMGISEIVDSQRETGARFDFIIHPTIWNSAVPVPNVTVPSGYHLWQCSGDYSYYSYRYELLWKDRIYADVSFTRLDAQSYLMRCKFVNNTDLKQNCLLNAFAALEYPNVEYCSVSVPKKCVLINANDYSEYEYAVPRPWDKQNADGMHKGQFADRRFYKGFGLGDRCANSHVAYLGLKPFGCEAGDRVSYKLNVQGFSAPVLTVRYRTVGDEDARFLLCGKEIDFPRSKELSLITFDYNGDDGLVLKSLGKGGIEFDFFAVTEKGEESGISAVTEKRNIIPLVETEQVKDGYRIALTYKETGDTYYILTHSLKTRQRGLDSGCLEDALPNRLSNGNHTYDELTRTFSGSFSAKKSDEGFFHNTLINSIFLEPNSEHSEYMVISKKKIQPMHFTEYERIISDAQNAEPTPRFNEAGAKYRLCTDILKATLLTNTVYPLYNHGKNIIHFTPGKRWDSFYTWDSGIIGLGVLEYSVEKSLYILDTYLADKDNKDFAFLLHGSLVPTQFAQYFELAKYGKYKIFIYSLYEKMLRYYNYIAGHTEGSGIEMFGNGLLSTYEYWYSCSGMDDYPAQEFMIKNHMQGRVCPCISTSHAILAARIMRIVALDMGRKKDAARFEADIKRFSDALNDFCWDEDAGYYSYTVYDGNKNITGFLRNETGENLNKGMDGIYPLVAGAAKGDRRERLLSHLKNPNEMWSESGLSAVDMSASYFLEDGYWNGNVWMAHQWYIWKTMFDLGDTDFAFKIADRALGIWKNETDFSYNTYECFGIKTQRGGWFHNFGGLSAPICVWANAYYRPGTVTAGFDVWMHRTEINTDGARVKFKYYGENGKYSLMVCLSDEYSYKAYLDNKPVDFSLRNGSALEITLPGSVKEGELTIVKSE